jgi:sugar phosphate permease
MAATESLPKRLNYRWLIFGVLAGGYILVYFHRLCAAVVAVEMMQDLHTTGALLGLLSSAYFYPYALMQIPAGLLADTWGPRRTITWFFLVAFIGSLILGVAPSLAWAILGRTLVGIGVSMLFVPTMKVLAEWFAPAEFAGMTGIMVAMGGVGSLSAAGPLAYLSSALGWRACFVIVGLFTLVLAGLVWWLVRDRPADLGFEPIAAAGSKPLPPIPLGQGVKSVLFTPAFWPLAVWFFFGCAVFFAFIGLWGGPYLMQVYGLSKAAAGNILSMSAVGMIVGSPLLSFLSNRVFQGRKPLLVLASFMAVALTALLVWATATLPVWGLYVLCLALGVFTNAIVVIGFTAAKELFPLQIAGTSTGLVNLFPFLGGALFQPLLGYLLERHGKMPDGSFTPAGFHEAFLVLFAAALLAFLASLFIKETMKKER